jgi:hypothetical protein
MTLEEDSVLWLTCHPTLNLNVPSAARGMAAYNQTIREIARQEGASLVDLDRAVPKDLDHLYDDIHPTRTGCDLIAREILDQLPRDGKLISR